MPFHFQHAYLPEVEEHLRNGFASLSEKDRRRYAAVEAVKLGHGGLTYLTTLFGCSAERIVQGLHALQRLPHDPAGERVRRPGGGKKRPRPHNPQSSTTSNRSWKIAVPVIPCAPPCCGPIEPRVTSLWLCHRQDGQPSALAWGGAFSQTWALSVARLPQCCQAAQRRIGTRSLTLLPNSRRHFWLLAPRC